jgi:hypothetical protein
LPGSKASFTRFQLPLRMAPWNASTLIKMSSCGEGWLSALPSKDGRGFPDPDADQRL